MATYCSIQDVKDILSNTINEKVKFSENSLTEVKILKYNNNNSSPIPLLTAIFNYRLMFIDSEFYSNETLRFKFTSNTDFNVFEVNDKMNNEYLISTGSINNDWNHPELNSSGDPVLTIPTTCWVSGFVVDSAVQLKFITNLSSKRGEAFIGETEIMIDQMLSKQMLFKLNDTGLNYTFGAVPQQISLATKYLTAYYVYVSLYANVFISKEKSLDFSLVSRWKTKAEELVYDFANIKGRISPSSIAFPSFMDSFGVDGEGPGFATSSSVTADITRDAQVSNILSDS